MVGRINSMILLFLLLSCGSIYLFLFRGEFILLGLLFFVILSFYAKPVYNRELLKKFFISTSIVSSILVFNWIVTGFSLSIVEYPKYLIRVLIVNFALFVLYNNNKYFSYKNLEWIFKLVVVHALLNFIFGFFFRSLFISVGSQEGYQASSLLYIFFYMANINIAGFDIYRNQSFFWEPGVLSCILNLYLFILLLVRENVQKSSLLIFLVCFLIITTFSTTGLGLMVILFCVYFFKDKISLKKITVLILASLLLVPILIMNIREKMTGGGEVSYIVRYYDSFIALDIIRSHPIFGIGLSSEKYNAEQIKYPRFSQSELEEGKPSTNSILGVFTAFGIPLGLLILYGLYKQILIPKWRKFLFLVFVIFLASEPLILSAFFIMFICSLFYYQENKGIGYVSQESLNLNS
ncbi:O-antigen ligase family protein [Pedobacter cryoconitis]|uniref:O-antigen ligase-related domain-containing protein n=1 Tax=Pedobacter cryoconitis TaxID=188932 RepID=A0A327SVV0_9SPHI|nr:O-antigen ligase family protein [Pedobacter cryoconitis]RAJ33460.1 hypothetical protein LY11_01509 [Pedobacter cryoconitis]